MTDIALTVNKESVYEEVAQTTSYTGAKMNDRTRIQPYFHKRMRIRVCWSVFGMKAKTLLVIA